MPQPKSSEKPVVGEKVEVWNYTKKKFEVRPVTAVLHMGMKGWTVEIDNKLYIDIVEQPLTKDITKPHWREYRG